MLGGETRNVSVLFADLEGFTAFSEQVDPAELIEMLNEFWAEAVPAVAAEGGMVERFAASAALKTTITASRVGVNSGPAMVGNVGSSEHRSFTAIGDTTNLAARLQSVARSGEVVIGKSTRDALGDHAVTEALDPLSLKGKSRPIDAFRLLEAR